MKFATWFSLAASVAATDPCEQLCMRDGLEACAHGSWGMGGVCYGYRLRSDGSSCYHGHRFEEACPFNLPGLTVEEAEAILSRDMPREPVSFIRHVTNMFHPQPVGLFDAFASIRNRILGPRRGQIRLSSIRTLARQVLVQANRRNLALLTQAIARQLSNTLDSRTAEEWWQGLDGGVILAVARRYSFVDLVILLQTNLNVEPGRELEFAAYSGFTGFCIDFEQAIVRRLLALSRSNAWRSRPSSGGESWRFGYLINGWFSGNLPKFCPELFEKNAELRMFAFRQRLYVHGLAITSPLGLDQTNIITPRQFPFFKMFPLLLGPVARLYARIGAVVFSGEDGRGVGLTLEWFSEMAKVSFGHPELFRLRDDSDVYEIHPHGVREPAFEYYYRAVGRFLGLSIVQEVAIGVKLPVPLFLKFFGQRVMLEDIKDDDPALYKSLKQMSKMDASELESVAKDFTSEYWWISTDKVDELIDAKINAVDPAIALQLQALRTGFTEVIPPHILDKVSARDLRDLILGVTDIDPDELILHMQIEGSELDSPQIVWLFDFLRTCSNEDRRNFLNFVTGSRQLPLGGFVELRSPISVIKSQASIDSLPTARICFNILVLPMYPDEATLQAKLLTAIRAEHDLGIV